MDRLSKATMTGFMLLGLGGLTTAQAQTLDTVEVADGVYAIVGPHGQRSPDNFANNATFGAAITSAGIVLIDSGGSAKGAAMIDAALAEISELPVSHVINTGGQDHRWLGNGYFQERGAALIASNDAVDDQQARETDQLFMLGNLLGEDRLAGTEPVFADETFDVPTDLNIGGVSFRLIPVGPAHTPGDAVVWLPQQRVAFAGDVVFAERLLGILPVSSSAGWIEAFDVLAALEPAVIVPGHGRPLDLETARAQTRDYLAHVRSEVGAVLDNGGDIHEATAIDQRAFAELIDFEQLAKRNAQAVFIEMEWE